jgi:4-hydroxythreonine-4-phosphate dehydrogenase
VAPPPASTPSTPARPRLAVVVGDPRGIGPEVVRKALRQPLPADVQIVGGWDDDAERSEVEAGRAVAQAIEAAARQALAGQVDAIVTGPVHKQALHAAGYKFPGVTEFLAHLSGDVPVAMMLATARLRVVLVTTHLPLRDVIATITTDRVVNAGRITNDALQRWWGIATPRLAVCALNPHAGEGGLFGDEDERVLRPAATALGAAGPISADTVFVKALRGEFDAVLAPYHDVGMTAVKVSGFGTGVNVTLGLPFIRTAPDHGTAFDIAGKGVADAGSMRAALELAVQLAAARKAATN